MNNLFKTDFCSGDIEINKGYDVIVNGQLNERAADGVIYYVASSPPDYRTSYSGSGLPFANRHDAFEGTPNTGQVSLNHDGSFQLKLAYPNSYMIGLGSVTVPPTVFISYKLDNGQTRQVSIKISEGIPFRSLTYPVHDKSSGACGRHGPSFYSNHHCLPIRQNQEEILRQSAYPKYNLVPDNFWGMKPSV